MNNLQRQLLADRIDEIERRIDSYTAAIDKLRRQLVVKETRLAELIAESKKLREGIDW